MLGPRLRFGERIATSFRASEHRCSKHAPPSSAGKHGLVAAKFARPASNWLGRWDFAAA
jgi:hypothetical protein